MSNLIINQFNYVKIFLSTFSAFALTISSIQIEANTKNYCLWRSISDPNTFIKIKKFKNSHYLTGILFHQGKEIRELIFTQSNGYGSKWWGYAQSEKPNEIKMVGGGRLLEFKGNYPVRSKKSFVKGKTQYILVGLGSDFYYDILELNGEIVFPFRNDKGFHLIDLAEGYFTVEDSCVGRFFMN